MSIANKKYEEDKKKNPELEGLLGGTETPKPTPKPTSEEDEILGSIDALDRAGKPPEEPVAPVTQPEAPITGDSAAARAEQARKLVASQTAKVAEGVTQLIGTGTDLRGYSFSMSGPDGSKYTQENLTPDRIRTIIGKEVAPETLGEAAKAVVSQQEPLLAAVEVDPNTPALSRFEQAVDAVSGINWKMRNLDIELDREGKTVHSTSMRKLLTPEKREQLASKVEERKKLLAEKATYAVAAGRAFQDLGAEKGGSHVNDPNTTSTLITQLITMNPTEGMPYANLKSKILEHLGMSLDNVDTANLDLSEFGEEDLGDYEFDFGGAGAGLGGDQLLHSETTTAPGMRISNPQYANQLSQEAHANWVQGGQQAYENPLYGDPLANAEIRGKLIKEREVQAKEYNRQFQELLRKSENKALTHNIIEGLGSIVAGLVGLATDLNVSGYYKQGESKEAADYYNQAAPALQDAAQRTFQELDNQINHYLQEGERWEARETQRFAQMQAAKQQGIALDLQYMQLVGSLGPRAANGDAAAQELLKQMGEERKYAQNMYTQEMSEVVGWVQNTQGTLKDFRTNITEPYTKAINDMGTTGNFSNVADASVASRLLRTQGLGEDEVRILNLTQQVAEAEGVSYHEAFKNVLQYHTTLAQRTPVGALNSLMLGNLNQQQHTEILSFISLEQQLYGDNSRSGLSPAHIQSAIERAQSAAQWRNQASAAIQNQAANAWYTGGNYVPQVRQAPQTPGTNSPLGKQPAGVTLPEEVANRLAQPEVVNSFIPPQNLPKAGRWRGILGNDAEKAGMSKDGRQGRLPPAANNDKFLAGVTAISSKYGLEPDDLLSVMAVETQYTFNPRVVNPDTGATGLIQFMPSTAAGILASKGSKTREAIIKRIGVSPEDLDAATQDPQAIQSLVASLPINFQLSLVDDYFGEANRAKDLTNRRKALEQQGKKLTAGWLYTTVLMGNTNAIWSASGKEAKQNQSMVAKVAAFHGRDPATFNMTAEALAGYFDANTKKPYIANTRGAN